MTESNNSVDRRQFVQLATLGAVPAACLLNLGNCAAFGDEVDSPPESTPSGGGNKVRISTTQTNSSPYARGLATDPFSDRFVATDLRKSVDGWLKWY